MKAGQSGYGDRIKAALLAGALLGLTGYVLIAGLVVHIAGDAHDDLKLFGIAPTLPPPAAKNLPSAKRSRKHEGAASPPNLRAKPSEVVAPPVIHPLVPPLVVVAPTPGPGSDPSAGASEVKGPGAGSGGEGTGSGSGGEGDGAGGGETPLRWIKGRIKDSDYPRAALKAGIGGTVHLRFVVGTKGRVTECSVTRSSGNLDLDETTCRLIKQRFRYEPTRDATGRAVPDVVTGEHVWTTTQSEDSPGDPEP